MAEEKNPTYEQDENSYEHCIFDDVIREEQRGRWNRDPDRYENLVCGLIMTLDIIKGRLVADRLKATAGAFIVTSSAQPSIFGPDRTSDDVLRKIRAEQQVSWSVALEAKSVLAAALVLLDKSQPGVDAEPVAHPEQFERQPDPKRPEISTLVFALTNSPAIPPMRILIDRLLEDSAEILLQNEKVRNAKVIVPSLLTAGRRALKRIIALLDGSAEITDEDLKMT